MRRFIGLWLIIFGSFLFGMALGKWPAPTYESQSFEVIGKHESAGKYYIETMVEVSPEEYIGLEVGDEFEK